MVGLAVVAILVTVGVPSMRDLMTKSRLSGQVQELSAALSLVRSEAIKRGVPISLCKSNNNSSCGGNWGDGWIAFIDSDNNGSRDTSLGSTESILHVFPSLSGGYTLSATDSSGTAMNYITYSRFGMAKDNATFVFCKGGDITKAKAIILAKARLRIATDTNQNGIPNKEDGSDISSCGS